MNGPHIGTQGLEKDVLTGVYRREQCRRGYGIVGEHALEVAIPIPVVETSDSRASYPWNHLSCISRGNFGTMGPPLFQFFLLLVLFLQLFDFVYIVMECNQCMKALLCPTLA